MVVSLVEIGEQAYKDHIVVYKATVYKRVVKRVVAHCIINQVEFLIEVPFVLYNLVITSVSPAEYPKIKGAIIVVCHCKLGSISCLFYFLALYELVCAATDSFFERDHVRL
jgi:hypothetical protein